MIMPVFTPERVIQTLRRTPVVLGGLIEGLSQQQAQTATDGPDGWSVVEIVCHLRDWEDITYKRTRQILDEDYPQFSGLDAAAMARERDYQHQDLRQTFDALVAKRRELVTLVSGLTDEPWQRRALHPVWGDISTLDSSLNVIFHDLNHIEQVVKALGLPQGLVS